MISRRLPLPRLAFLAAGIALAPGENRAAQPADAKAVELCAAPMLGQPMKGPHLSIEARVYDFGAVAKGTKVEHRFVVNNLGTEPLEIKDVQVSCGCTTTGEWTRLIAPGKSGAIPVVFDSTQFTGPVHKTITVTSNCSQSTQATLELTGIVRAAVMVSQPVVVFPAVTDPTHADTRLVTITHEVEGALQLTELRCDNPLFQTTLKEVVPGREYQLAIATVAPVATGTHTGRITLKSSDPAVPVVTVQAVVTVLAPVQVAPAAINLPGEKLTAPEKRFIVLLNHRGGDLTISDLETNAPGVTFAPQRSPDGKQFTIAVNFPAGFEARRTDKIYFRGKTSHPALPTFEVPLVATGAR